jgi:aryl-alcohol dehydrogenase-like predicted oxidoreductase
VLNDHARAGRIRAFGGSNWTPARVDEANAYAKARGLQGFSATSNNFSLARMVEAPWRGCLASSEPSFRAWHARTGTPNVCWSSQARGFFSGRARPDALDDAEMVRCWYCDDNFARLKRAEELGAKRGVAAINVALAYVLCQPFLTFPIIGPATPIETRTAFPALDLELSASDLAWLNLET